MATVLITGCSSGIGLEAAIELARRDQTVVATMRDLSRSTGLERAAAEASVQVEIAQLDVTDDESVRNGRCGDGGSPREYRRRCEQRRHQLGRAARIDE